MNCNPKRLGRILDKRNPSEFEIQAEIYHLLRSDGIRVRGEVTAKQLFGDCIRRCKFDLVVFDAGLPILIIETKTWKKGTLSRGLVSERPGTRQHSRYTTFGIPIIYCGHIELAPKVVEYARELLGAKTPA